MGKGLSIVDKAQKLAFQHWIEAVIPFLPFFLQISFFFVCVNILIKCKNKTKNMKFLKIRLILDTGMDTICINTMKNGVKLMLVSHSFTGMTI